MARFSAAVAAMHAAWAARVEAQTPGLHCPLPRANETSDDTRNRFSNTADQSYRLRLAALRRALAAGWPGITKETSFEAPGWLDDPDPIGDFMRWEIVRDRPSPCAQIEMEAA